MTDLRDVLGIPEDWPDAGTPEFWEQFGCEGSNEYRDCHDMSADYARLRRLERRVEALADDLTAALYPGYSLPPMRTRDFVRKIESALRDAMKEAETDG